MLEKGFTEGLACALWVKVAEAVPARAAPKLRILSWVSSPRHPGSSQKLGGFYRCMACDELRNGY